LKRVITVLTGAAALLLAAGCGSGTPTSGSPASLGDQPSSPAAASPASSVSSSQLHLAGTLTESAAATTMALTYRVGPIQYTPPPAAVVDACPLAGPGTIDQMAFTAGEVTIGYNQGSLVQEVQIDPAGLITGGNWVGTVAFDLSGHWQCEQNSQPIDLNVPPHSDDTYPIWIMSLVLTNAQPKVSQAEADSWQFFSAGIVMVGYLPTTTTGGPNAASCGGSDVLMVYAHLPFTFTDPSSGNAEACTSV
jgi:hypothetical protein